MGACMIHLVSLMWISLLAGFVFRLESAVNRAQLRDESRRWNLGYEHSYGVIYTKSFCYYRDLLSDEQWNDLGVSCDED